MRNLRLRGRWKAPERRIAAFGRKTMLWGKQHWP